MGQQLSQLLLGQYACPRKNFFLMLLPDHAHRVFRQVTDDTLHITPHVADFSEFGRFNFDERSIDKLREATCDFCFSDACRSDHQNIFRNDFFTQLLIHPAPAISVPQGDCNSFLGFILSYNIPVKLVHDLPGSQLFTHLSTSSHRVSTVMFSLV